MSGDSATEWAKATQEISKTAKAGIEIADKSRAFLYSVIGQHLETAVETFVGEPLRFLAAKRHLRLVDRYYELLKARRLEGKVVSVPLKIALPAFEHASLEMDDSLQDLWANLLISAGDPTQKVRMRSGFVDIIKQLEPIDAKVLSVVYCELLKVAKGFPRNQPGDAVRSLASPTDFPIEREAILGEAAVASAQYEQIVDNLTGVGCVAPYLITDDFTGVVNGVPTITPGSAIYRYGKICITALGVSFVETCVAPGTDSFEQLDVQKPIVSMAQPIPEEEGHRVHYVTQKHEVHLQRKKENGDAENG
jgi:hypothetical protein